jgi:hypothetical protein
MSNACLTAERFNSSLAEAPEIHWAEDSRATEAQEGVSAVGVEAWERKELSQGLALGCPASAPGPLVQVVAGQD